MQIRGPEELKSKEKIIMQLDLKLGEYISGHNDFDEQTKHGGYIEALKYVLELNQYCLKCEHHEINHTLWGLGYCMICEPDNTKCQVFSWKTDSNS